MTLVLTGLEISVYTRIVRMALAEKYLRYSFVEADPFAEAPDPALLRMNPFRRVPVLSHDGFAIFETNAILRYLDAAFPEPALVPHTPRAAARMAQVMGIVDCYGYWPLVRQGFSHRVLGSTTSRWRQRGATCWRCTAASATGGIRCAAAAVSRPPARPSQAR